MTAAAALPVPGTKNRQFVVPKARPPPERSVILDNYPFIPF
jgi:hypothetical protein